MPTSLQSDAVTILLQLSKTIVSVRERKELLATIFRELKAHLPIDDTAILILDKTGQYWQDWTIRDNDQETEGNILLQQLGYGRWIPLDRWMAYSLQQAGIISVKQFQEQYPEHPFRVILWEFGVRDMLHVPLVYKGKPLGVLMLDAKSEGAYQPAHLSLVQLVADLIAVAVANILANEEILAREREKSALLAITEAISRTQNRKQLLRVVYEHIKNVFPFDNAGLFVIDEPKDLFYELLDTESIDDELQYKLTAGGLLGPWPLSASLSDSWWMQPQPLIRSLAEEADRHRHHPGATQFEAGLAYGLKQFIGGPLFANGRKIGAICFNSRQEQAYSSAHIPVFTQISNQVAVAVASILANEEIREREREKTLLLEINATISASTTLTELLHRFDHLLKPVFQHTDAGVTVVSKDRLTFTDYYALYADEIPSTTRSKELNQQNSRLGLVTFPFPGSLVEYAMSQPPMLGQLTDVLPLGYDAPYIEAELQAGLRYFLTAPMTVSGQTYGLLILLFTEAHKPTARHLSLFSQLTDTIAVALANILANEEIREREREMALQLAVRNGLAEGTDWEQKFLAMVKALQPHIPFDYCIVGVQTDGQTRYGYSFYRTGADEYQTLLPPDFFRLSGLSPERFAQLRQQADYTRPLLLNGEALSLYVKKDELKRLICQTFRLQSHLLLPIPLTQDGQLILAFYARHDDTYRSAQLNLGLKLGASIALTMDRLLAYEQVAALSEQLKQENTYLQEEVNTNYRFEEIVGTSQAMRDIFHKVSLVGPLNSTVIILGESGTGKELIARAIHQASPRHVKPLIKINCAALPTQLIESELFGHEKGAFTGAVERRIGKFELSHESTIFLDEIGELPLELQAKLLRVLQEKEFERLGSNKVIKADVRVLAATNRNLEKEVAEGRFRADLYFRLNVYPIKLPPLRERREDISLLALHFCQKLSKKLGKPISGLSNGAIRELQAYHWPGNIRELEHVMERAAIESVGDTIKNLALIKRPDDTPTVVIHPAFQLKSYDDHERELILNTLRHCNGRIRGAGGAAQILKVKATTLEARMKKLGIRREFAVGEGTDAAQAPKS
ncbi:sigma-54-dependent Fis family transcriptional regulator [Spirosoma lituiforme]